MAEILILGGGFGGVSTAVELAARGAGKHRVTLVDRREWFQMGLAKLWTLVRAREPEAGRGDLRALAKKGIRFVRGEINAIHADRVDVATGGDADTAFPFDALVVALGAETAWDAVPGMPQKCNLYDAGQVPALRDHLAGMQHGRVAIVVVKPPYKCPPAPYEAALLIDRALAARGTRGGVEIAIYIPEKLPLTVAGPVVGRQVLDYVTGRGIRVETERVLERVESEPSGNGHAWSGKLHFAAGETRSYDLLLAIPEHRAPDEVAGLADASGWIPVDPATLETGAPNVWAIGDVAAVKLPGGGMLPKAGIFAEAEGRVVAERILAKLAGRPATAVFDGAGQCWFETGGGEAMAVRGAFFGEAAGRVALSEPSEGTFREKEAFERDRLAAWFG